MGEMAGDTSSMHGTSSPLSRCSPWLARLVRILAIYLVCHELSRLSTIFPPGGIYPHLIWLTEGANLAALILFDKEAWVGVLLAQWGAGTGLIGSICSAASCALRLALAQILLNRFHFNPRLERLRDFAVLVLGGGVVATGIGTLAGGALICATGFIPRHQFWIDWRIWWIGDMTGIIALTPLILTWANAAQRRRLVHRWKEFCFLLASVLLVNFWFSSPAAKPDFARLPLSNPMNPLLIWAALRLGPIGEITAIGALFAQTLWLNWASWQSAARMQALAGFPLPVVDLRFTWLTMLILAFAVHELGLARGSVQAANRSISALVETSPLAIVALNPARQVVQWNRAAEESFGWTAAEMVGRRLALPEWEPLDDVFTQSLSGGEISCTRSGCFRRDGEKVDLHLEVAPMRAKDGAITGIVAILADVTAQRRMEEELQQRHHLEAMGRLAGGIAHDFNNILSVILGQAELLMTQEGETYLYRRLAPLRRAALQASSLTSRLLAFSRQRRMPPQWLDLNTVVPRLDPLLRERIGGTVDLTFRPAERSCLVLVDPCQCEQLLLNLCMSAAEGPGQTGTVEIETCTRPCEPDGSLQTLLSVRFRACESTTDSHGAALHNSAGDGPPSGLGLAIVQDIVQEAGAILRVLHDDGPSPRMQIVFPAFSAAERAVLDARGPGLRAVSMAAGETD